MISLKDNKGRDRLIAPVTRYKAGDYEETALDRQRAQRLARELTGVMKQAARELKGVDIRLSRLRTGDD